MAAGRLRRLATQAQKKKKAIRKRSGVARTAAEIRRAASGVARTAAERRRKRR